MSEVDTVYIVIVYGWDALGIAGVYGSLSDLRQDLARLHEGMEYDYQFMDVTGPHVVGAVDRHAPLVAHFRWRDGVVSLMDGSVGDE